MLALAVFLWSPFFLFVFFHDLKGINHARTEIFFLFIIIELLIALNSRSLRYSFFKLRPHKWLVLSVVSQLLLTFLVVLIPVVRKSFGIILPTLQDLATILIFGVFVMVSLELSKAYLRRFVYAAKK
jgi:Ca2+-transporting ATPase